MPAELSHVRTECQQDLLLPEPHAFHERWEVVHWDFPAVQQIERLEDSLHVIRHLWRAMWQRKRALATQAAGSGRRARSW